MTDLKPTASQARALRDMVDGHITLYAIVRYFHEDTGEKLDQPEVLGVGYDRVPRLDPDWWKPLLANGWIALPGPDDTGLRCTVTEAGRAWLAEHDKEN
ncbi:hypothetical protein K1W54_04400 [Micromonospora sp. CPCC 205371]|nr:hypothetical protein [Micromonospora sp. CPCC 205371]